MNTLRPPSAEAGHQKSINRFLKSIKGLYRVIRAKISRSPDVPAPSSAIWPFVPVVKITNSGRAVPMVFVETEKSTMLRYLQFPLIQDNS